MAKSANTTNPIPRKCSVEECERRASAKGLCKTHYERQRRWGRVHLVRDAAPKGATEKWLREHVAHEGDECLNWPYGRNALGYGIATIDGYCTLAHRLMCILAHGEPPFDGAEAAHYCGGGAEGCVNPNHVRWATRSLNQKDKTLHGTHRNPTGRFTEEEVMAIFADVRPVTEIAKAYGCTTASISCIKRGKHWSWLTSQKEFEPNWTRCSDEIVRAIFADPRPMGVVAKDYGCSRAVVHGIRVKLHYAEVTQGLERAAAPNAQKLTRDDVLWIYRSSIPAAEHARRFGCTTTLIYAIRNGRTWARVTGHKRD